MSVFKNQRDSGLLQWLLGSRGSWWRRRNILRAVFRTLLLLFVTVVGRRSLIAVVLRGRTRIMIEIIIVRPVPPGVQQAWNKICGIGIEVGHIWSAIAMAAITIRWSVSVTPGRSRWIMPTAVRSAIAILWHARKPQRIATLGERWRRSKMKAAAYAGSSKSASVPCVHGALRIYRKKIPASNQSEDQKAAHIQPLHLY